MAANKNGLANADDRTQEKLLEAAGQIFAELGYQAATVREICTRAGANVAAVNYHFGDKLGLYIEVLKHSMGDAQALAVSEGLDAAAVGDPREGLRQLLGSLLYRMNTIERASWYLRILAHEMAHPTPALDRVVSEVIGPNYDRLRRLVGRIIDRSPDDDVARLCTHSIIGQVLHYAHARPVIARLWPGLAMTPERQQEIADHIATFSIAGLEAIAIRKPADRKKRKTRTA